MSPKKLKFRDKDEKYWSPVEVEQEWYTHSYHAEPEEALFCADESEIVIEGKKHFIIAAICFFDPRATTKIILNAKKEFGIDPHVEVKWNQKKRNIPQEDVNNYKTRVLEGINDNASTALITVTEKSKQLASKLMIDQIADFCRRRNIPKYSLHADVDLIPDIKKLEEYAKNKRPSCDYIAEIDSAKSQLIQTADIFAGVYNLLIRCELGDSRKYLPDPYVSLPDYLRVKTRYMLPGNVIMKWGGTRPFKGAWRQGFRLHSTISQKAKRLIRKNIANVDVGCMH